MVFVSKIYLSFLAMLGSYQEYVFIMILQGVWLFFFFIGYEMDSEIRAL